MCDKLLGNGAVAGPGPGPGPGSGLGLGLGLGLGGSAPQRYGFAIGENGAGCLVSGWSEPETHYVWSDGGQSVLRLPVPPGARQVYVELHLQPFAWPPALTAQRLNVRVNGVRVAAETLSPDETRLGFYVEVPAGASRHQGTAGFLPVKLVMPDACSPASLGAWDDRRALGFSLRSATVVDEAPPVPPDPVVRGPLPAGRLSGAADDDGAVRAVTALSLAELAVVFEPLGVNCEFGMFQRRCGVEPLGLLRFAGLTYIDLLRGLEAGFAGLDDVATLRCVKERAEWDWMVSSTRYGFQYHSFMRDAAIEPAVLLAGQSRVLRFRQQKLLDLLASGEKLFVVQAPQGLTTAQVLPLARILRGYGPGALLFATDRTERPAGSVEVVGPGLFLGSMAGIQRVAGDQEVAGRDNWLSDAGMTAWVSICAHAYRLWRESGG